MLKFMITFVADFALVCREVAVYKPLVVSCHAIIAGILHVDSVHEELIINPK